MHLWTSVLHQGVVTVPSPKNYTSKEELLALAEAKAAITMPHQEKSLTGALFAMSVRLLHDGHFNVGNDGIISAIL
jgi:hypothetical protein